MLYLIKIGTTTITDDSGKLDLEIMSNIAKQTEKLVQKGIKVILISSGAIGCGMRTLAMTERPKNEEITTKQICASVGQAVLMSRWQTCFGDRIVSQHLITSSIFLNSRNLQDFKNCLYKALEMGIVPIINENDAVSTEEIDTLFTDNDSLAVEVSLAIGADKLVILSDINGLYDMNPKENPDAKIIKQIQKIDEKILSMASGKSTLGTGGMRAKLQAISRANEAGIKVFLTNGKRVNSVLETEDLAIFSGTLFDKNDKLS